MNARVEIFPSRKRWFRQEAGTLQNCLGNQQTSMHLWRSHVHRVRDGFVRKQVLGIWLGESTDPNVPAEENRQMQDSARARLMEGNRASLRRVDTARLIEAAKGQHPYAIIVCCSDSRVIPEQIFNAGIGELFVIRVAGNVLDNHQIGSIEYAAGHLHCGHIVVLGHTGCGAVATALAGGGDGFIRYITEDILSAVGGERDPDKACCLNVMHVVNRLKKEFSGHPEVGRAVIEGAVYDIRTGEVRWLEANG